MKICTTLVLCLVSFWLQAQNMLPNKHFRPGRILLPDSTIRTGYIRDYIRLIATSDLWFLQKSSDASAKPAYNGAEPIFSNGTEGRLNDYFLYEPSGHTLQLVNTKTMARVIPSAFFKQK